MTPNIDEKTLTFDAEDMQKKASIPPCFSTVLGRKTGGTVPKTRVQQDALQKIQSSDPELTCALRT